MYAELKAEMQNRIWLKPNKLLVRLYLKNIDLKSKATKDSRYEPCVEGGFCSIETTSRP